MDILITGGTGFIGSHTSLEILQKNKNFNLILIDNLKNSKLSVKKEIEKLSKKKFTFIKCDLLDKKKLNKLFIKFNFKAVIHFAALKSVEESVKEPIKYYNNNVVGTLNLLSVMKSHNVKKLIFSSSAAIYCKNEISPLKEESLISPSSPYGETKAMMEKIIKDTEKVNQNWKILIFRYFNPAGTHKSGLLGENIDKSAKNLFPIILKNLISDKKNKTISIFGSNYKTKDGTGVRDYIHVSDVAKAHYLGLLHILKNNKMKSYVEILNIGTGSGYSVIEIIQNFEKVLKTKIKYKLVKERPGDVAQCFANVDKIKKFLSWSPENNLEDMIVDSLHYLKKKFIN